MNYSPPIHDANAKQVSDAQFGSRGLQIFLICLAEFFERFAYYGARSIFVLYMIMDYANGGLNMENEAAFAIYGWFTIAIYAIPLPIAFITDLVLNPRLSSIIGGVICAAGFGTMAIYGENTLMIGLMLVCLGTSFIKPALTALLGKQYRKDDKSRDAGFIWYYMAINIGAFLSGLIVSVISEQYGWNTGFLIAAGAAIASAIVVGAAYQLLETPQVQDVGVERIGPTGIPYNDASILVQRGILAAIIVGLTVLFWFSYELIGGLLNSISYDIQSEIGIGLDASFTYMLNPIFLILFLPILALILHSRSVSGKPSPSVPLIGIGMLALSFGLLIFLPVGSAGLTGLGALGGIVLFSVFATFGELFIGPIALSYITRLAPAKFITTFVAGYIMISGFGNKIAGMISESMYEASIEVRIILPILFTLIAGVIVVLLRRHITSLGHGIE